MTARNGGSDRRGDPAAAAPGAAADTASVEPAPVGTGSAGHGSARWVRPARIALVVVLVCVIAIVAWPDRPADGAQTALQAWFARAHAAGLPGWISFGLVEFLANVVMFVPAGLLGVLARLPGGLTTVLLGAALLSTAVELVQQTMLPHRTGDPRDVVANVLGALIGALLAQLMIRRADRHRP